MQNSRLTPFTVCCSSLLVLQLLFVCLFLSVSAAAFVCLFVPHVAKLEINPVHRLLYDCVILCHCTLAAALYFEQSSCDELMEFKQIQTRAQPEES